MVTLINIIKISLMFVKKFYNNTVYIFDGYLLSAHTGNKWCNCCREWRSVVTCSSNTQQFSTNGRINYTRWYITWFVWHFDNGKRKWVSFIKRRKWNFPSFILMSKSEKLASSVSVLSLPGCNDCNSSGQKSQSNYF